MTEETKLNRWNNWQLGKQLTSSYENKQATIPRVLVLDGGSTYLLEKLLPSVENHEALYNRKLWSSSLLRSEQGRALIKRAHHDFLKAGCDMISSVTYQCNFETCSEIGSDEIERMLHDGVRLAREAVNELYIKEKRVAFVVATIGCYGASLADGSEYTGKYDLNEWELVDFHLKKVMTLAEAYPDWIAFETIPCLGECSAIMKLLKTKSALLKQKFPVWISFACCDDKHLNDGSLLSSALDRVFEEDPEAQIVNAVGVNCCSATNLLSLITIIAQHRICKLSSRGIVFYPNRGETWDAKNNCWKAGSGSDAVGLAKSITETIKYIDNDTAIYKSLIVGGCCRTEPCHIRQIRSEINEVAYE